MVTGLDEPSTLTVNKLFKSSTLRLLVSKMEATPLLRTGLFVTVVEDETAAKLALGNSLTESVGDVVPATGVKVTVLAVLSRTAPKNPENVASALSFFTNSSAVLAAIACVLGAVPHATENELLTLLKV